jgi:hypothetical protein
MERYELRDLRETRLFLLQGLWLQRVLPPTAETLRPALDWGLELAQEGHPLPPIGVVADMGHLAFGLDWEAQARARSERVAVPGLPPTLMRTYEDHVLGKLYTDWTFARAGDALRHYPDTADRERQHGLAYLLNQFRERAGFAGVELNPAVLKALLGQPPEQVLAEGWESIRRDGLAPLLVQLYESVIATSRRLAEVLAEEDVIELERRTVLAEFAQRLAFRQVLQAVRLLGRTLPPHRLRPSTRRQEVPTRVLDEDTYPVGGFASIATRGSIESLLHSQLAYMEKDERPDLFDIKFLRDELLYYARDENQFLRRRRTFVFVFYPDLAGARFKDAGLPYQRLVLTLALLLAAVRKAAEWLSTDALRFEFLFLGTAKADPLAPERELLTMLLHEQIDSGMVRIDRLSSVKDAAATCAERTRRSLCHCLLLTTGKAKLEATDTVVTRLQIDGVQPTLHSDREELPVPEIHEPLEGWTAALEQLLQLWV